MEVRGREKNKINNQKNLKKRNKIKSKQIGNNPKKDKSRNKNQNNNKNQQIPLSKRLLFQQVKSILLW